MNVGDGQAVLIRGPNGAILIDGGPSPARLSDELGSQLPPWQRSIDALVITAPGLGHIGGLAGFERPATTGLLPKTDPSGSAWRTPPPAWGAPGPPRPAPPAFPTLPTPHSPPA